MTIGKTFSAISSSGHRDIRLAHDGIAIFPLDRAERRPRTTRFATIEPVDLDAEPIRCHWDTVDMVMQDGGAFCRDDDDTDE